MPMVTVPRRPSTVTSDPSAMRSMSSASICTTGTPHSRAICPTWCIHMDGVRKATMARTVRMAESRAGVASWLGSTG